MAVEIKFFVVACVAWCCISMGFSAAIPLDRKPLNPDHVPSSTCASMTPVHGNALPSTDPAPYTVTTSKKSVIPGEIIRVIINGIDGAKFKGIYLQARVLESGVEAVGKFSQNNLLTNSAIRISSCPPGSENAVSYVSREAIESLVLEWEVPETATGKIYFRSTFVESFAKFWINVDSEPITISESA